MISSNSVVLVVFSQFLREYVTVYVYVVVVFLLSSRSQSLIRRSSRPLSILPTPFFFVSGEEDDGRDRNGGGGDNGGSKIK
jgi:hypothetical protein